MALTDSRKLARTRAPVGSVLVAAVASALLAACPPNGGGDGGDSAGTAGDTGFPDLSTCDVQFGNNHGHVLSVTAPEVEDTLENGIPLVVDTEEFANEADHGHVTTFEAEELAIVSGNVVASKMSGESATHQHLIVVVCE